MTQSKVRVRFAPSPTGPLHIGGVRTALFNYLFSKHHGGDFLLRIEDTDQSRYVPGAEDYIIEALGWCGIRIDEGPREGGIHAPYRQSERKALYAGYAQELIDTGYAYYAFDTPEELDALRTGAEATGGTFTYDNSTRKGLKNSLTLPGDVCSGLLASGEHHVVRFKMPENRVVEETDLIRGHVQFNTDQLDDKVLFKSDGMPTYHLANVVDDHLMGITHVIRAEEWLNSTPKHLALYEAFGWDAPVFVHMPLLRNADKSKISKRKNPTSLEYYQRAGILPEAMLNFLMLMGYSRKDADGLDLEKFTFEDFFGDLDLTRISLGGPVFDLKKLDWLNGLYLRAMAPEQLAERQLAFLREDDRHGPIAQLVQERVTSLGDYFDHAATFYAGVRDPGLQARFYLIGCGSKKKNAVQLDRRGSKAFFDDAIARLEAATAWQPETIEAALRAAIEGAGVLVGDGLMAIRVAISGRTASPPLFETIEVLGRSVALVRLRAAAALLGDERMLLDTIAAAQTEIDATKRALEAALAAKPAPTTTAAAPQSAAAEA